MMRTIAKRSPTTRVRLWLRHVVYPEEMARVGIVGTGHVGMAAAAALFHRQHVSDIILVDIDADRAEGEAMDLMHGQALVGPCIVRAAGYGELGDADVVVVSEGVGQEPGESRLALLERNVTVFDQIVSELDEHAPNAIVVIATNPVDVLTAVFHRKSQRPASHVVGTGTLLDSARLRALLGRHYGVDPQSVHAYVLGEHGDSEFVAWSLATIGGAPILGAEILGVAWDDETMKGIAAQVSRAAYEIIERKGHTNWAIGAVIDSIVTTIVRDEQAILPVSVPVTSLNGELGNLPSVCLSMPTRVGAHGAEDIVVPPLATNEIDALRASAEALARSLSAIDMG